MKKQTIFRTVKQTRFTTVDNAPYQDETISWKAKGLLAYLLTKPNDWETILEDLKKRSTDGRDSVIAGLKELETAGYIHKYQDHDKQGRFSDTIIEVHEGKHGKTPFTDIPFTDKPSTDKPSTDKPSTDNPTLVKTELILNTESIVNTHSVGTRAEMPIQCFDIADALISFVQTQYGTKKNFNRNKWANIIRLMNKMDHIEFDVIMRGVQFYAALEDYPDYCPVIHCAQSLRDKWLKLINYGKKLANKQNNTNIIKDQAMSDIELLMNSKQGK